MASDRAKLIELLSEQIVNVDLRAHAYVFDEEDKPRPKRGLFVTLKAYVDAFMGGKRANRWITLTGLRGVGKTTILFQLLSEYSGANTYRLFLSLDQTRRVMGAGLSDIMLAYEDLIGRSLEALDKPLLLFLDEVQYDPDWAIVLKTIFDRSDKVFIFATGSAALLMNVNTDVARRAVAEKLHPLSFSEYLMIKSGKPEPADLSRDIRDALLFSEGPKDVFGRLRQLESDIRRYFLGVSRHELDRYLNHGSLPVMIASGNEAIAYDQIQKTLDRVVLGDIASTGRLSSDTVAKVSGILYAVADMDAFNFATIANHFGLGRPKVAEIFALLESTEVLHRIYPHGSHLSQAGAIRKPSKFLFSSPAFRAMYYKTIGNTISPQSARGKLLEDLVGMYLHRIFHRSPGQSLTYDSAEGGADFILGTGRRRIVLEVGSGKKGYRQVVATSRKVKADYGLVICEEELEFASFSALGAVKVPLRTFLLA